MCWQCVDRGNRCLDQGKVYAYYAATLESTELPPTATTLRAKTQQDFVKMTTNSSSGLSVTKLQAGHENPRAQ